MSAKGTKDYAAKKRWMNPTPKQLRILNYLKQYPGVSIADLCLPIDGIKKHGSALYTTIKRMIRRGFIRTEYGVGKRYKLFTAI